MPWKYLPPLTFPVTTRSPLVSIGEGVRNRPLRPLPDEGALERTADVVALERLELPIALFVPDKMVKKNSVTIIKNRLLIIIFTQYQQLCS